ncbi:MAG: VOC family protein [Chloroflexi bacterium]|nr:VOC family protein [Chloroflexota bacterium]
MVATMLFIVADQDRTRDFYRDVLGAQVVLERDPVIMQFHNTWLIFNVGGSPTEDKPGVTMTTPADPSRVSMALNVRVADIASVYDEIRRRGGEFMTPPIDRGAEIRCYLSDPDGYIIEFGQSMRRP